MQWPVGGIGRQYRLEYIWTDELAHGKGTVGRASKVDTYRSLSSNSSGDERKVEEYEEKVMWVVNSPAPEERMAVPTKNPVMTRPQRDRMRFAELKIRRIRGLKPSNS